MMLLLKKDIWTVVSDHFGGIVTIGNLSRGLSKLDSRGLLKWFFQVTEIKNTWIRYESRIKKDATQFEQPSPFMEDI